VNIEPSDDAESQKLHFGCTFLLFPKLIWKSLRPTDKVSSNVICTGYVQLPPHQEINSWNKLKLQRCQLI